jgi:hypothetical protein
LGITPAGPPPFRARAAGALPSRSRRWLCLHPPDPRALVPTRPHHQIQPRRWPSSTARAPRRRTASTRPWTTSMSLPCRTPVPVRLTWPPRQRCRRYGPSWCCSCFSPAGAVAGSALAGATTPGTDACLAAILSSPSATAAASAPAASLVPSGLGLSGYPTCIGALTGLLSPTRLPRQQPPGFSTTRPLVADATWTSAMPSIDSALASTITTIQAALEASKERERAATRALDQERTLGATLTAQMATAQRLIIGPLRSLLRHHRPPQRLPTPLDSTPITSPLSTPRSPVSTTSSPSYPSCWTPRPLTTFAGEGRSSSPCGATFSMTSSPRRPRPGP